MVNRCAICKKSGIKGFFSFPVDSRRDEWLKACELSVNSQEVKSTLRVCFRHFPKEKLTFWGKNLRPAKGKS